MVKNEGTIDRGVRAVIGVLLIAWALFTGSGNMALWIIALIVGLVLIVTAAVGFCPLYRVFGINTNKK